MSGPRCPYCLSPVGEGGAACLACGTAHHPHCIAAHGACTLMGCAGRAVLVGGQRRHVDELAQELELDSRPLRVRDGQSEREPRFLRIEGYEDEPASGAMPPRLLRFSLRSERVRRGERLRGELQVSTPTPLRFVRLAMGLRTVVETRIPARSGRAAQRRDTRLIDREAVVAGQPEGSQATRLVDGVLALFGKAGDRLTTVAPGRRRYPFSLPIDQGYPATVEHSQGGERDRVTTQLWARLETPLSGSMHAESSLVIL